MIIVVNHNEPNSGISENKCFVKFPHKNWIPSKSRQYTMIEIPGIAMPFASKQRIVILDSITAGTAIFKILLIYHCLKSSTLLFPYK